MDFVSLRLSSLTHQLLKLHLTRELFVFFLTIIDEYQKHFFWKFSMFFFFFF